jgi:acetyl esterase
LYRINTAASPTPYVAISTYETGDGSASAARFHKPGAAASGLVIYIHGGGWRFGSPASHEHLARLIALETDAHVLSVDYRLAPEHPFPAPRDDVLDAIHAAETGRCSGLPKPAIALAGDSAGAALALSALIRRRDLGLPPLAGAALFYGCFTQDYETGSYKRFGDGTYGLPRSRVEQYWRDYLGDAPHDPASGAVPGEAPLAGMPPLFLHAAGLDVLLDDTLALAARLAEAQVRFRVDVEPGLIHGHLQMAPKLAPARRVIKTAALFLREALDG